MFPLPLTLTVQPSRRLRAALAGLHAAAGAALWLAALPAPGQWAGSVLLIVSLARLRRSQPPVRLRATRAGTLEIGAAGEWRACRLLPDSVVTPWLTVLRYRCGGQRVQSLPILGDCLHPDEFRRLRVWARWLGGREKEADGG